MKATAKRLLALIMAMAMCLSLLQGVAFAAESSEEAPQAEPEVVEVVETKEEKKEVKAQDAVATTDARTSTDFSITKVKFSADGSYTVTFKYDGKDDVTVKGGKEEVAFKKGDEKDVVYAKDSNVSEEGRVAPDRCKDGEVTYKITLKNKNYSEKVELPGDATKHDYRKARVEDQAAICGPYDDARVAKYTVTEVCTICGDQKPGGTPIEEANAEKHTELDPVICVDGTKLDTFKTDAVKKFSVKESDIIVVKDGKTGATIVADDIKNVELDSTGKPVAIKKNEAAYYVKAFKCGTCSNVYMVLEKISAQGTVLSEPNAVPYYTVKDGVYSIDTTKNVTFSKASTIVDSKGVIDTAKITSSNVVDGANYDPGLTAEQKISIYNWGTPSVTVCGKTGSYIKREMDSNGTKVKDTNATLSVNHKKLEAYIENAKFVNGTPTGDLIAAKKYDAEQGTLDATTLRGITAASCGQDGSYEIVVYCTDATSHNKDAKWDTKNKRLEISRTPVKVPASDKHVADSKIRYNNITATLDKDGTVDEVTACAICGDVIKTETKELTAKTLNTTAGKAKYSYKETGMTEVEGSRVEPTAYKNGSVKMATNYTLGDDAKGGGQLKPEEKVLPATGKTSYTYKLMWKWPNRAADKRTLNEKTAKAIVANASGEVYLAYTDVDYAKLTDAEKKAIFGLADDKAVKAKDATMIDVADSTKLTGKITVEQTAAADDFPCAYGTRTFKATVADAKSKLSGKEESITVESSEQTYDYYTDADDSGALPSGKTLAAHVAGPGVVENEDPTTGYYEVVVKCKNCNTEMSRTPGFKPIPTPTSTNTPTKTDISGAVISGSEAYRGEYFNVAFTVELDGKTLVKNVDYVITNPRENNFKGVGPHTIKIAGIGDYEGEASGKVYITETSQDVFVTPTKKSITAKSLKKKSSSFTIKVDGAKGKVSFSSSSKKVTVNANGKVTVKKGTKKGTYKVTVKVARSGGFLPVTKTITITVK